METHQRYEQYKNNENFNKIFYNFTYYPMLDDTIEHDNFDLEAIFGDDIKINESDKQKDKNKEINKNNINKNTNNNNIINNNLDTKNNEQSNEKQDEFSPDIFNNISANFFEDLKDAKNTTIKKYY